eukprot:jgi/Mesvir1/28045/Mv04648-RA.1
MADPYGLAGKCGPAARLLRLSCECVSAAAGTTRAEFIPCVPTSANFNIVLQGAMCRSNFEYVFQIGACKPHEVLEYGMPEEVVNYVRLLQVLNKGTYLPNWRRRWFVLKNNTITWYLHDDLSQESNKPRGTIEVRRCVSVKGAEDVINNPHAFELAMSHKKSGSIYLIADSDKEKEEWINAVGRAIVHQSRSMTNEVLDY